MKLLNLLGKYSAPLKKMMALHFQGQDSLHGDVRSAEADRPAARLRLQVPRPALLQAPRPHEHAHRRRGQGQLHHDALRPRKGQPTGKDLASNYYSVQLLILLAQMDEMCMDLLFLP